MKFVQPHVYLIGETRVDFGQLREMLGELGEATALEWLSKTESRRPNLHPNLKVNC
jgi:hypothetical protein